tara:strand:- start:4161 stop:4331 length:171 start_codon:yes stop_codon:yes gene_type:complete
MNKKSKPKKTELSFKDLVVEINKSEKEKTQYSDNYGKGVVKGHDVAAIRDILNDKK